MMTLDPTWRRGRSEAPAGGNTFSLLALFFSCACKYDLPQSSRFNTIGCPCIKAVQPGTPGRGGYPVC
ncbi:hypothetical protein WG66_000896 [Moniliophthora roreri]|nr:hypothetical protein WG66_000896 [Moniliophthora roreri]